MTSHADPDHQSTLNVGRYKSTTQVKFYWNQTHSYECLVFILSFEYLVREFCLYPLKGVCLTSAIDSILATKALFRGFENYAQSNF